MEWTKGSFKRTKLHLETAILLLALFKLGSMTYYSNDHDEQLVKAISSNHHVLFEMLKSQSISKQEYDKALESLSIAGSDVKKLQGLLRLTCSKKDLAGYTHVITIKAENHRTELQNSTDLVPVEILNNSTGMDCEQERIEKGTIDIIVEHSATEYWVECILAILSVLLYLLNLKDESKLPAKISKKTNR